MYISRIIDKNIGPISKIDISPSFMDDGKPKPLIIVGENGSGKSTMISNIVDSLYELAGRVFSNALHHDKESYNYSYYKVISSNEIKVGERYLFSRVIFDNRVEYLFKTGDCSFEQFKNESGYDGDITNWDINTGIKEIYGLDNEEIKKIFSEYVICYLGPERYEKPSWLGDTYYDDLSTHLYVEPKFSDKLKNPIMAYNIGKGNFRWLLDVIADSRADIDIEKNKILNIVHTNIQELMAMLSARRNIEKVMSIILNEEVYFGLNLRVHEGARFNIKRVKDDSIIALSMDSLSTGQLALFNIFTTIIRYADNNDINKSVYPDSIKGIVIIDEIELHLHSIHQKNVLPRLMKAFPYIQFIVTTHSPLFLLGLEEIYGDDGLDIYQMPDGNKIGVESFSEFKRAYEYFTETETHNKKLREAIDKSESSKPIIITEGATDWKHMLAAYNKLSKMDKYKEVFNNLDFEFFKYETKNSNKNTENKIDMGNAALSTMCESYSKIPNNRRMIFIADCDDDRTNKKMSLQGVKYKTWGNNVFSFILPVPDFRKDTPKICIEHLYSDDEIKTEYKEGDIPRRLYLGNEFNSNGYMTKEDKCCENRKLCGSDKISIIDGSSGDRVINPKKNNSPNFALSKMDFAECILEKKFGFENFDFSNFVPIFEIIKEIIENEN
nr:AAA family ATPase [uncultured Lachnoanaerobaculum sp.]